MMNPNELMVQASIFSAPSNSMKEVSTEVRDDEGPTDSGQLEAELPNA
jgi:hypothetical protein